MGPPVGRSRVSLPETCTHAPNTAKMTISRLGGPAGPALAHRAHMPMVFACPGALCRQGPPLVLSRAVGNAAPPVQRARARRMTHQVLFNDCILSLTQPWQPSEQRAMHSSMPSRDTPRLAPSHAPRHTIVQVDARATATPRSPLPAALPPWAPPQLLGMARSAPPPCRSDKPTARLHRAIRSA